MDLSRLNERRRMDLVQWIKENQDKDGMLKRALERIIQLYTDKAHFVFELLQNAEDAQAQNIKFVQYDDRLEVYHDGKPFTRSNLKSLYDIGLSDKINDLNQIGEFGVGFKAVFSICERVQLQSEPVNFRNHDIEDAERFTLDIVNFVDPEYSTSNPLNPPFTTKFVFPYAAGLPFTGFTTISELCQKLTDKLENLNATTLLFMKNLQSIEYEIHTNAHQSKGCYMLSKTKINDHCVRVETLSDRDNTAAKTNSDISYLVFSKETNVFRAKRSIDIAFAFKEIENDWEFVALPNATVSVFFPTETESKLKFIVQGPYRTTPNRSSVPFDDPSNIELAKETAQLLYDSVLELKNLGKLNLSLLSILPILKNEFYFGNGYDYIGNTYYQTPKKLLFVPVFDKTKQLFQDEDVLPCQNGAYFNALQVKLVRRKELTELFTDNDLSALIGDKKQYYWLPYVITASGQYQELYTYLNEELGIGVITPESLCSYLNKNSLFLDSKVKDNEWLIKFYTFLISVPALCSRSGNSGQMLTVKFVKNQVGKFVAPYRKSADGKYLPNIFIPLNNTDINCTDIDFVDKEIFQSSCQEFFTNTLGLEKPQEYDYWLRGLKQRYKDGYHVSDEQHISDIKKILYFLQYPNYRDDLQKLLDSNLLLKCVMESKHVWKNPFLTDVFFTVTKDEINIKEYFQNVKTYPFVDVDFYFNNEISYEQLTLLHIKDNLIIGDSIVEGEYDTGKPGKKPSWSTDSNSKFKWKLYFLHLEDVLNYISKNPEEKSSLIKSSVIFKLLQTYEDYLSGTVYISGQTPNIENAEAKVLQVILTKGWNDSGDKRICVILRDQWDKKWLFTQSGELVSSTDISKYDLDSALYGEVKRDSKLYELLKFKKEELDIAEDNLKVYSTLPKSQKVSFGELWLKDFYGITVEQLQELIRNKPTEEAIVDDGESIEFPQESVKNWDSLRRHTAELLSYASPVEYQSVLRKIRVSKNPASIKTYLKRAYKVEGKEQFACQLCHLPFVNIEMCQLDGKKEAEKELDPMYLCLCPNCVSKFNAFKNTNEFISFRKKLEGIDRKTIDDFSPVIVPLGNNEELWFTQVHIAEIVELIKLQKQADREIEKQPKTPVNATNHHQVNSEAKKFTVGELKSRIGKRVRYVTNGFGNTQIDCVVTILNITDRTIKVQFEEGTCRNKAKGDCIELSLEMCLKNNWLKAIE